MLRLYWFNLKKVLRGRQEMFWPLLFPMILGTLFYATFGSDSMDQMNSIDTAVVSRGNVMFETFLEAMDGEILTIHEMEAEEAEEALKSGEVDGVFVTETTPALQVTGADINASILEMLMQNYIENEAMFREIGEENLLKLPAAIRTLTDYTDYVEPVNVKGSAVNDDANYFFALIAMACLFGSFMGMTAAVNLRADQSSLAARRSIVPTNRLVLVVSELLSVFTVQFLNICVLLLYLHFALHISFGGKWWLLLPVCVLGSITGVTFGIFTGTLRLPEGLKVGILVGSSLFMSFLAGLMFGGMKHVVDQTVPILNKINPAALISDAFYSMAIYENPTRYSTNILILGILSAVLLAVSYFRLRRERYDSL